MSPSAFSRDSRRLAWPGRLLLPVLAALFALPGLGCQALAPAVDSASPSPYLVAEGRAKVDPITYADQAQWTVAFSSPIEATGQATLDASIADAGQRGLMARAAARRAALRVLAQRALTLVDADGHPVSWSVARNGQLAQALNAMIEERAQVQCSVADRQVMAKASIQGQDLLVLLRGQGVALQFRLSSLSPERRKILQSEAYNRAVIDMRARLKDLIFGVMGRDGLPLRKAFEANPARMEALGETLLLLQADAIDYQEDGTCVAKIYFEQAKARALAYPPAPWWAFWKAFAQ